MGAHTEPETKGDKPKMARTPKALYPHRMYLGDMVKVAADEKEHMKLSKQGYSMQKPKKMK